LFVSQNTTIKFARLPVLAGEASVIFMMGQSQIFFVVEKN